MGGRQRWEGAGASASGKRIQLTYLAERDGELLGRVAEELGERNDGEEAGCEREGSARWWDGLSQGLARCDEGEQRKSKALHRLSL